MISLAALLLLSVGFYFSYSFPRLNLEGNTRSLSVKLPTNAINNASFVFFDDSDVGAEKSDIKLKKMVYGQLSSIFYFSRNDDLSNFSFELTDENGKTYFQDMTIQRESNAVAFEPFSQDATAFWLKITDIENNHAEQLLLRIKDDKTMPARYINKAIDISPEGSGVAFIDNAIFANTGSRVQLRFHSTDNKQHIVTEDTSVQMFDGSYNVLPKKPTYGSYVDDDEQSISAYPAYAVFQDIVLARVDFDPVRSLSGNINLSVKGLSRLYPKSVINKCGELFDFRSKGAKTLRYDDFNLVIEGMQHKGDVIALVMHGENTVTGNRSEVRASIGLNAKDFLGNEVVIPGDCLPGPVGTDVLFKVGLTPIIDMDPESMYLNFKNVQFTLDDINVTIKLHELDSEPDREFLAVSSELEGSFNFPAKTDLLFIDDNSLIGLVLESPPKDYSGGQILLHLVNAGFSERRWSVDMINTTELKIKS